MTNPEPARAYTRLFAAMNEVLSVLRAGGDEKEALARSFEHAAHGFGAEKALLLLVSPESAGETRLRRACVRGLSDAQVQACERGESVPGVSSSVIRAVITSKQPKLVENPLLKARAEGETPALAGRSYSVLCAPILDALRNSTLAVLYFQNARLEPENTYVQADLAWLEGYASALGQAFASRFEEQLRVREIEALIDPLDKPENAPELIGDSAHIQALRRELHEVHIPAAEATDPDPLLLLGEKGTGKDTSRAISRRTAAGAAGRSWRSTARRSATRWPRRASLATRKAPSPGRSRTSPACSARPTRACCSWTRSPS